MKMKRSSRNILQSSLDVFLQTFIHTIYIASLHASGHEGPIRNLDDVVGDPHGLVRVLPEDALDSFEGLVGLGCVGGEDSFISS